MLPLGLQSPPRTAFPSPVIHKRLGRGYNNSGLLGGHAAPLWQDLGIQILSQSQALQEADGHLGVDNYKSLMKACLHREGRVGKAMEPVSMPWGSGRGTVWGGNPAFRLEMTLEGHLPGSSSWCGPFPGRAHLRFLDLCLFTRVPASGEQELSPPNADHIFTYSWNEDVRVPLRQTAQGQGCQMTFVAPARPPSP